jgi:hypothetical protein
MLNMAVPRTEAAEEVENLTGLGDGMADVTQIVGEALELGAVVVDAQVALLDAAELRLEVDSMLELVVAEERLDVAPEGERRGVRLVDDVEDGLLDGVVEPIDDAMIDLAPLRRTLRQWRRGADVVGNPELAKNGLKEIAPLAVIGVVELKEDGHMRTDVHRLENGSKQAEGDRVPRRNQKSKQRRPWNQVKQGRRKLNLWQMD